MRTVTLSPQLQTGLLELDELDDELLLDELDDELLELEELLEELKLEDDDDELFELDELLLEACVCIMTVDNDCARGLNCIGRDRTVLLCSDSVIISFLAPKIFFILRSSLPDLGSLTRQTPSFAFALKDFVCVDI